MEETGAGHSIPRTWRCSSSTPRGLKILYPSSPYDAKGLLKSAIRDDNPVIFQEHKGLYRAPALREVLPREDYTIPLGEARVLREGRDLTLVTYGMMVHRSLDAARTLEDYFLPQVEDIIAAARYLADY